MINQKDRIEAAIRHIQTSVDIDPWAMELAVDALKKQIPKELIAEGDGYADGEMVYDSFYCPSCDYMPQTLIPVKITADELKQDISERADREAEDE